MSDLITRLRTNADSWLPTSDHLLDAHNLLTKAADELERLNQPVVLSEWQALEAETARLRAALRGLHDDIADYIRLNNLGGYDNHWMKEARAALKETPK